MSRPEVGAQLVCAALTGTDCELDTMTGNDGGVADAREAVSPGSWADVDHSGADVQGAGVSTEKCVQPVFSLCSEEAEQVFSLFLIRLVLVVAECGFALPDRKLCFFFQKQI